MHKLYWKMDKKQLIYQPEEKLCLNNQKEYLRVDQHIYFSYQIILAQCLVGTSLDKLKNGLKSIITDLDDASNEDPDYYKISIKPYGQGIGRKRKNKQCSF